MVAGGLLATAPGCGKSKPGAPEVRDVVVERRHFEPVAIPVRLTIPAGMTLKVPKLSGVLVMVSGQLMPVVAIDMRRPCDAHLKGTACIIDLHKPADGTWKELADGVVLVEDRATESLYRYDAVTSEVVSCDVSPGLTETLTEARKVCADLVLRPDGSS